MNQAIGSGLRNSGETPDDSNLTEENLCLFYTDLETLFNKLGAFP